MADTDPFTQVHQAVWAALVANTALIPGLVQPGNTINVLNPGAVQKRTQHNAQNVPEFDIEQSSFNAGPCNSICDKYFQTFKCFVATSLTMPITTLNQIKSETINAIKAAGPQLGLPTLVYDTRFKESSETYSKRNTDKPGGRAGFNAVINIVVELRIAK